MADEKREVIQEPTVFTIGYGNRSLNDTIGILRRFDVTHVVDIRTSPFSRFSPEFNQGSLKASLKDVGLSYIFMGDTLGGRPSEAECYEEGHVVYERVRETETFQLGFERLLEAAESPHRRICLLCSELRPEDCHRSKMIGVHIRETMGVVTHIDEEEKAVSQEDVEQRIHSGQGHLFAEVYRSRGKYEEPTGR